MASLNASQQLDVDNSSVVNHTLSTQHWGTLEGLIIFGGGCGQWREPQQFLFHLANGCFLMSYISPHTRHGALFMHSVLIIGFLLFSTWAWSVVCAPDVFSWNFGLAVLNVVQLLHTAYQMRPVSFDPELEEAYRLLFLPFKVSRLLFKKMVSPEFAQVMSLHAGEAYAMQNLTRTDRLGLLLSGKVNVLAGQQFLHHIHACEFLDSPEFESSRATTDDKFKVSIMAGTSCRYLCWQRSALEYLLVKETHLATVLATLVARDIATKLYAMNSKIVTEKGSHLDIRLPSIASCLATASANANNSAASPVLPAIGSGGGGLSGSHTSAKTSPLSPGGTVASAGGSEDWSGPEGMRPWNWGREIPSRAATDPRLPALIEPYQELPSSDVESWLESSSKFYSCEMADAE
ncbi:popeye domain-containing protein 3-like isoform X1 [Hetaerina americana]|uniref:popeye domain-containing protein 3-like isoform X1 n=1 Tax=Hetaerina americana TaxID=62018 RepID=UPI003A7F3250